MAPSSQTAGQFTYDFMTTAGIFAEFKAGGSWPGMILQDGFLEIEANYTKLLLLGRACRGERPPAKLTLYTSREAEVSRSLVAQMLDGMLERQ
jgi:hypothetical protein